MRISNLLGDGTEIDHTMLSNFRDRCLNRQINEDDEFLKLIQKNFPQIELVLPRNTITFRARVFRVNHKVEEDLLFSSMAKAISETNMSGKINLELGLLNAYKEANERYEKKRFKGFNAKDSFVNLNYQMVADGRCNHRFSPCLYSANDIITAISEVRPIIASNISVARIKALEDLKIINLVSANSNDFVSFVGKFFTQSTTLEHPEVYVYSQGICDFIRSKKYDGIAYPSCQNGGGINYAIFNYSKCKAISSEIYTVDEIKIKYKERKIEPRGL